MSDIHFIKGNKSDFQKAYFEAMDKRFEEQRKKSVKKGKGELTLEAFLDKEERDCAKAENIKFIYFLFPIIATALAYLYTGLIDGFGRISSPVIYVFVMLIASGLIALWHYKNVKKSLILRKEWIKSKRDKIDKNYDFTGD